MKLSKEAILAIGRQTSTWLPRGRMLIPGTHNAKCGTCGIPAHFVEIMRWSSGLGSSYFYFCGIHWRRPRRGTYMTPEQRANTLPIVPEPLATSAHGAMFPHFQYRPGSLTPYKPSIQFLFTMQ